MRNAIAADQRIQDIDTKTANQLRKWYQFKSDHDLLTSDKRRLAGQIGLVEIDVTGLDVTFGRDNVFVILNQKPLDLTGRIVSYGRAGE